MGVLEDVKAEPKLETIVMHEGPHFDLIIIGGGPAGLTAALYAGRARLKTLLVDKAILGGMVSSAHLIENYPGFPNGISGMDLSRNLEEHSRKFGVQIYYGDVEAIIVEKDKKIVQIDGKKIETKALIISGGTEPKKLNVKGEDKLRGRGVSYCATCDGPFYRGKNIVVVGGGNSALEEALYLTRFANKISIIHRRDKLRAEKVLAERALNDPKIFMILNSTLEEILGENRVEKIAVKNVVTGHMSYLPVEGVFVYVGTTPASAYLGKLIKLDENGFIKTDDAMATSVPGIFAAGDIRVKHLRQVITAAADGAIAAESARKYIEDERKTK